MTRARRNGKPWPVLPVLFRADREAGQLHVTAVFPTEIGGLTPDLFTVYAHVGQHGAGSWGCYRKTRPATRAEYRNLLKELRGIYARGPGGRYRLEVKRRMTRGHARERERAYRGYRESVAEGGRGRL